MAPERAPPTLGALRRALAARLKAGGIETAELDARLLLAHALGCVPSALLTRGEEAADAAVLAAVEALLARRLAGEPVARLTGEKEFWSLSFALGPDTLVPRPDTETLVEAALSAFEGRPAPRVLLDLGTGTGALLAALLTEWPSCFGVGVDLAFGAARIARDNLARAEVAARSAVLVGDWGAALKGGFDVIVSNPPYIPTADIAGLAPEVRAFDPPLALDGGADGLNAYAALAQAAPRLLAPGGALVLELGIGQEADVARLLEAAGLKVEGPARRDLSGIARALLARRP